MDDKPQASGSSNLFQPQVVWKIISGTDDSPNQYLSGTLQQAGVHFSYSDAASAIASPYGIHVDAFVGALFHSAASPNTPMANIRIRQSWTIAQRNTVSLSGDANTYFRANVADPFRFTLGGPLRLYASSVDEYRGTDDAMGRLVYLRKIATLPTGVGEGVYLTGGYEAGNIWSPEAHSILRQDAFGGLLLSTPLGALTLGGRRRRLRSSQTLLHLWAPLLIRVTAFGIEKRLVARVTAKPTYRHHARKVWLVN